MKNLDCTLCNNTRHRTLQGRTVRCSCFYRIWVETKLPKLGFGTSLLKDLWTSDHRLSFPATVDKTQLNLYTKLVDRLISGDPTNKPIFFIQRSASKNLDITLAHLAAIATWHQKPVAYLEVHRLVESYFDKASKLPVLPDITILKFGSEMQKNLASQLVQQLAAEASTRQVQIIYAYTDLISTLKENYKPLTRLLETATYFNI